MAGALERIIEDTLQYTTDRTQFGKPIGKFQVIQQNMAMAAAEVAAAVMAAQNAFRAAEQDYRTSKRRALKFSQVRRPGWRPIFATKRTVQLGSLMSITCISLREGFGLGGEFGAESEWAEQLGRRAAARGADALWSDITERQSANA